MNEKEFLERFDRIKEIPTLPSIVLELNQLLQDPNTSVARISQKIEKDQAIAFKILKLVNSAFYGVKSKVGDIRSAVIMLGFNSVRNAILSTSVIGALSQKTKLQDFDVTSFWKHSLAVAVTSKSISHKTRINSPDNCFVAGLLHDVGKVIMAQYLPGLFATIWNASRDEAVSFNEAEKKLLPADHAAIGAHLASRWQLPQGLTQAIRWHHDYQPATPSSELSLMIHVGDIIVNHYNKDPNCVIEFTALHPDARKLVMGVLQKLGDFYATIAEEIEAAYAFFLPSKSL